MFFILTAVVLYCAPNTRCYYERRCIGAGRYEAMAEGHDCFNPPRDRLPKKFIRVWQ